MKGKMFNTELVKLKFIAKSISSVVFYGSHSKCSCTRKKKSKYYLGITKQQLADDCDNKGDDKKKERKNVDLFQNGFYFYFFASQKYYSSL